MSKSPPQAQDQDPGSGTTRPPALRRLGRYIARRPRVIALVGVVLFIISLVIGSGAMNRLLLSRFESPGSQSLQVAEQLQQQFDTGKPQFMLLVTAKQGTVDDPQLAAAGRALEQELANHVGVLDVSSYWSRGGSPALRSNDSRQALIIGRLEGDVTQARTELGRSISPDFTREDAQVRVQVGGADEVFRQAAQQARTDFFRGELIALPMALILLFAIYRRFRVAALTLGMGFFAVVATLALLRGVTYVTEVSTFAANLTLVMGLGLGIDYSLFIINRYRESLRAGRTVQQSVEDAVATAGKTVAFSGVTVAVSLACLMLFPFPFLRSFAYSGVGVVATSVFAALVILPAVLALLGRAADRRKPPRNTSGGAWHTMAVRMMKRPLVYGVPALVVVLALGSPVLGLQFGLPDDRILPPETSSRVTQQSIRDNFGQEEMDAIQLLTDDLPGTVASSAEIERYATALSNVPGVAQVDALTGSYRQGQQILEPNESSQRFADKQSTWFSAVPTNEVLAGGDVATLVSQLRSAMSGVDVGVGGYPSELNDFRTALVERLPVVLVLIFVVTFIILFLMTGSVLLPAKATVLNVLSMSVMFGALVWVFQDGNLAGLLDFTPTGQVEPTFPILMFCIAYGLSMDYEVFMMSRIKEEHDRTGDNVQAVAVGIERSGPLITAAAVILALAFASYGVSGVMYLKMLGIGMALVILVDATLIRAVLVPVFMRLAGNANWWAPAPLRKLHERFGITEQETSRSEPRVPSGAAH
ncbi:MMPL family transporter [Saccharopolyspora pogona]|uniref:MMPL family transporter n=1 Tax=Saccharopolyspora pogona TaxID=333966 RepID=UPI001CC23D98|nr:MMPL family transporter [Saccharopolyspora pogona]